jgi:hypothetical protein
MLGAKKDPVAWLPVTDVAGNYTTEKKGLTITL